MPNPCSSAQRCGIGVLILASIVATQCASVGRTDRSESAQAPAQTPKQIFLPALEFSKKSVGEWTADFEKSAGTSIDPLWCIYYYGDRSKTGRDFLELWLHKSPPNVQREIEAILVHWNVMHEPLPPQWLTEQSGGVTDREAVERACVEKGLPLDVLSHSSEELEGDLYRPPSGLFPYPTRLLELPDETLVKHLHGDDRVAQAEAAVSLIVRDRSVADVLMTLTKRVFDERDAPRKSTFTRSTMATDGPNFKLQFEPGRRDVDANIQLFDTAAITRHALQWISEFCAADVVRVFSDVLKDESSSLEYRRWLVETPFESPIPFYDHRRAHPLIGVLAELARRPDELGDAAFKQLSSLAGLDPRVRAGVDWTFHSEQMRMPLDDASFEATLAELLELRLRQAPERGRIDAVQVALAGALCLRSPLARERAQAHLHALIQRGDAVGLEALRALCHLGVSDDEIRAQYVARLDALDASSRGSLESIPCLQVHDPRTLAALERIWRKAQVKDDLLQALSAGGLMDSRTSWMAREYAASLEAREFAPWYLLFGAGFRGLVPLAPADCKAARVDKLAINLRTKRELGEDTTAEAREILAILHAPYDKEGATGPRDFYYHGIGMVDDLGLDFLDRADWCLSILLDRDHWEKHVGLACRQLEKLTLDRRQQALLCKAADSIYGGFRETKVFARQGAAAIERAARIRRDAQRWNSLAKLRDLLAITAPAATDIRMLCAALTRGGVRDREEALSLISDIHVDSPDVRKALDTATSDRDEFVRDAARKLKTVRGW